MPPESMKLSELVATLSLVSDLGMGRPMERVLRQTVIAMRLADDAEVGAEVSAATYYTSLLTWVGCATDTSELAELFGDETRLFADSHDDDLPPVAMAMFIAKHLGYGTSRLRRIGMVGKSWPPGPPHPRGRPSSAQHPHHHLGDRLPSRQLVARRAGA